MNVSTDATARVDPRLANVLACPRCLSSLELNDSWSCSSCDATYSVNHGVPDLRPPVPVSEVELEEWSEHWADDHQQQLTQRFFSFYRKAVFARTVSYFIRKHFPREGVFVEAGAGTSETSFRIDKHNGARLLVAVDIVPGVIARAHPVMDARICADIFKLPFRTASIDGLWNVGVMEHFTHDRIDTMMREFLRVLRPGAPLLLLWPGTTSLPQRMLAVLQSIIRLRSQHRDFRFHPAEISQLRSSAEGRAVLSRNGFSVLEIEGGPRSLFAFKTVVGAR